MCSRYSIRAAFNNKDKFGFRSATLSASTSMKSPARIVGLKASPSVTQIEVSWGSSTTSCPPDYYIIRYSLYQRLACPSPETILTEFEVNTTSPRQNNLADLEPYSKYRISVIAVNGAGRGEATISYASTTKGRPSTITNVMVDQEGTSPASIRFTWQSLTCKNVNGLFNYYYTRIYENGDRSLDPVQRRFYTNRTSSSVEFDNLEPCTMYELSINAVSSGVPGVVSRASGVTGVPFRGASALAIEGQPSLIVFWSVPSRCNVDYYKLSYQLNSRKGCQDVPVADAPRYERNVTSVSTTVSERLSNLEYYATYAISITAVIRGAESLPENMSGNTVEGEPGPPIGVILPSSDLESIMVEWMSPNPPLGRIIRYYILYWETDAADTPRNISFPHRNGHCSDINYRFSVIIPDLRSKTNYSVQVQAETIQGVGTPSPDPPVIGITSEGFPSEPDDVTISNISKSSILITWVQPKYPRGRIISYTLAYRMKGKPYDSSFKPGDEFKMEKILGNETSFLLEHLNSTTLYEVYVTASTSKGEGESSACVQEYTTPTPGCFDACSKICRCSEGVSDCDTVTGVCFSGKCMEGWSGLNCQIASPRLSEPPSPVYTSCDTIAIIWKVWNGDRDSGEGPIGGYDIYVKTKTSAWAKFDFISRDVIPDIPSSDILRYVLNDLDPDVEYTISVSPVHIDDTGKSREHDGRGEEVTIRTKCEPRSIPWAGMVSGITLFFLVICGGFIIGRWLYGRRASMDTQQPRASRPLPPVKKDTASFSHDLYENPSFSGLSEDDHIYTSLHEDIKYSNRTNLQSEDKHQNEKCGNPRSAVIYEYEDVKSPKNDEEHEYEISVGSS